VSGRCRHENAIVFRLVGGKRSKGQRTRAVTQRCQACDAQLSLGPATDTPAVLIEVRAAELAALLEPFNPRREHVHTMASSGVRGSRSLDVFALERAGWWVHQMDLVTADVVTHRPEALAGYLARCIATHEEESSNG
jgi:hypothetical protein